jgi:methionyl-tRNA formyltransferase
MKIIFMGTPDFSLPTLKKLSEDQDFEILAVYTKEPKIAKRGQKIQKSVIHDFALSKNLAVLHPKNFKDQKTQQEFINFKADIAVVVAYGLILPSEILTAAKYGCVNIHPSMLPKWRGAAPIQRSIMAGDTETSIAIMKMDEGLDSGDVIDQMLIKIEESDNYKILSDKLSVLGAEFLLKTLKKIQKNDFTLSKQDHSKATYANKIEKSECLIDWQQNCRNIINKIRALSGFLDAYFFYKNEKIKILSAEIIDENNQNFQVGTIIDDKFSIQCLTGIIRPIIIQKEGKKPILLKDFLLGNKPSIGDRVDNK